MQNLERLIHKAETSKCRILLDFNPFKEDEAWAVSFFPEINSSSHYYAFHSTLEDACGLLMEELRSTDL